MVGIEANLVGGERTFEARRGVVLATGTRPEIPPLPGLETVEYWTNHEAVETEEVPASLAVLGGGAVGLELAQVFARFGSEVRSSSGQTGCSRPRSPKQARSIVGVFGREGIDVRTGWGRGRWPG